jgi:hypothetical protein
VAALVDWAGVRSERAGAFGSKNARSKVLMTGGGGRARRVRPAKRTLQTQLTLPFPNTWGGRRAGAGRKPGSGRSRMRHASRPNHRASEPVFVTLRSELGSLRSPFVFPTILLGVRDFNERWEGRFRIVHFSVQTDHLHLMVEASTRGDLLAGVRGFSISIARRINRLVFRRGRVFADRWHGRALRTPRAVRSALVYLLGNFRKHGAACRNPIDTCSSAPYFSHFSELSGKRPVERDPSLTPRELRLCGSPVSDAESWLLRHGWLRHGLISIFEAPAPGGSSAETSHSAKAKRRARTPRSEARSGRCYPALPCGA